MSNVEILYEGPYRGTGREQIVMSVTGKWFSRQWGEFGGLTKAPWEEIEKPRRPWPTDTVFIGWTEAVKVPIDPANPWARCYRGPTQEECESCIKGSAGYLRLVPGPHNLRVPLTPAESTALSERRQLFRAASVSQTQPSRATRL